MCYVVTFLSVKKQNYTHESCRKNETPPHIRAITEIRRKKEAKVASHQEQARSSACRFTLMVTSSSLTSWKATRSRACGSVTQSVVCVTSVRSNRRGATVPLLSLSVGFSCKFLIISYEKTNDSWAPVKGKRKFKAAKAGKWTERRMKWELRGGHENKLRCNLREKSIKEQWTMSHLHSLCKDVETAATWLVWLIWKLNTIAHDWQL